MLSDISIRKNGLTIHWEQFKREVRIKESDPVRVYPNGDFEMKIYGKWQIVQRLGHFRFWTMEHFEEEYNDAQHKAVQGQGYVVWRNGDFDEPFSTDLIIQNMPS